MNRWVAGLFTFTIVIWGLNYPFVRYGLTLAPLFSFLRVTAGLVVVVATVGSYAILGEPMDAVQEIGVAAIVAIHPVGRFDRWRGLERAPGKVVQ